MSPPSIAVLILNWRNAPDTIRCLDALGYTAAPGLVRPVVIDNGSGDGSVEAIRAAHPGVEIVCTGRNLGFARGVNAGLRRVLSCHRPAGVIAFLNNDAVVSSEALLDGATRVRADHSIGLLTGKIVRHDGHIWYGGGDLRRFRGGVRIHGQGQADRGQCDQPRDVTFLSLAFAIARTEVVEQVGLLAEEYFFGQEEWDYSLRVRRAGYRLRYEPSIVCRHGGDGSHDNSAPEFIYNGYRNKLIFQRKHLPRPAFMAWRLVFWLYARILMPALVRKLHTRRIDPRVLRYCAAEAIRDDARQAGPMEERDLLEFRRRLQQALPESDANG